MPWSKLLTRWVPRLPRIRVPKVWIFRPGRTLQIAMTFLAVLAFPLLDGGQVSPVAPPPPQPAPLPISRFVVVLDAAHGGDDTGARLDSGQLEKSANLSPQCPPPFPSHRSRNPGHHHARVRHLHRPRQARRTRQPRQGRSAASASTPAKAAPEFISLPPRSRPASPHVSWRGKPHSRRGSPAVWLSPEQ